MPRVRRSSTREQRHADQRRDHADGQLERPDDRPRDHVREDEEAPPTPNTSGRSVRWSGRATVRTAWGTTSPTKPMMPQVATLAAVSNAVQM